MDQVPSIGDRIAASIKDQSKAKGLDARLSFQRIVAESVLIGFRVALKSRFLVGGGLIHDQTQRQTGDADIRFIRQHSVEELQNAFINMEPVLAQLGIRLSRISPPQYLEMPNGVPGMRFKVEAFVGGSRVDTQIDIAFGNGRACNFPMEWNEGLPTFIKGQPVCKVFAQKPETQVAEKLVTIMIRGESNTRWKDHADIAMLSPHLDRTFLAQEIARVIEDRRLDSSIFADVPAGLDLGLLQTKAAEWAAFTVKSGRKVDMTETLCAIRQLYSQVRKEAMSQVLAREQREAEDLLPRPRASRPRRPGRADRQQAQVIELDRYRHTAPRM